MLSYVSGDKSKVRGRASSEGGGSQAAGAPAAGLKVCAAVFGANGRSSWRHRPARSATHQQPPPDTLLLSSS
jgi:hypothetical protein